MTEYRYRAVIETIAPSLSAATNNVFEGNVTLASPVRYQRNTADEALRPVVVAPGQPTPEPRVVTANGEHELAVIGHLRGWCHDSAVCLICTREIALHRETQRINEIIGG